MEVRESSQRGPGWLLVKCTLLSKLRREADGGPDPTWGAPGSAWEKGLIEASGPRTQLEPPIWRQLSGRQPCRQRRAGDRTGQGKGGRSRP